MICRIGQTAIELQGVYRRLWGLLAFAYRTVGRGREVATGLALVEAMATVVSILFERYAGWEAVEHVLDFDQTLREASPRMCDSVSNSIKLCCNQGTQPTHS